MPPGHPDLLRDLAAAYPRERIGSDTLAVYERELADIGAPDLAAALRQLMRTDDRWPSIAAVRRTVSESALDLPAAEQALAQVEARVRDGHGTLHPLTAQALEHVGGLYAVRHTDEPSILRSQFLRLYREMRDARIAVHQAG